MAPRRPFVIVAALIALPVAYMATRLLYTSMDWEEGPFIARPTRAGMIAIVGYTICVAVAIALAVHHTSDRAAAAAHAAEAQREAARRREAMNDPDVQRGMEIMSRLRAQKAETRPADSE